MTTSIAQTEPKEVHAGDTWRWQRFFADYSPADGWTSLEYWLQGAKTLKAAAVATSDNSGYDVTVLASDTARLEPGIYEWNAIATHTDGRRATIAHGILTVKPDFAQLSDGAVLTHEERMIPKLEAVLEGRITDDIQYEQIGGRVITMIPVKELEDLLQRYRDRVRRRRAGGRTPPHVVVFR